MNAEGTDKEILQLKEIIPFEVISVSGLVLKMGDEHFEAKMEEPKQIKQVRDDLKFLIEGHEHLKKTLELMRGVSGIDSKVIELLKCLVGRKEIMEKTLKEWDEFETEITHIIFKLEGTNEELILPIDNPRRLSSINLEKIYFKVPASMKAEIKNKVKEIKKMKEEQRKEKLIQEQILRAEKELLEAKNKLQMLKQMGGKNGQG